MFKTKTSMKVISLVAAVIIWLYVMGEVDPDTRAKIADIPVSFSNTEVLAEYGLAVAFDEQMKVSATISGKRSDVNEVKKHGLTANIDVSECVEGQNTEKVVLNLPVGINLENISESTLTFDVEHIAYEHKPVEIDFSSADATGEAVLESVPWILGYHPEEISVSGAKSSVDKVYRVLGIVDADDAVADEEKEVNVKLVPVNKKGREIRNVNLYQDTAEVTIRELSVSTVDLVLNAADKNIDINELDINRDMGDRVRIVGTISDIENITEVNGIVTVDGDNIYIDTDLPENVFVMLGEENGKIIWN